MLHSISTKHLFLLALLILSNPAANGQRIMTFPGGGVNSDQERQEPTCSGDNERYTSCASSTCFEETCADIVIPTPNRKRCSKNCQSGCQCKPGFYRNQDKRCVDELTCIMCGYHENWVVGLKNNDTTTTATTTQQDDEKTCDGVLNNNKNNTVAVLIDSNITIDLPTTASFVGCQCANGYYRSRDGLCVSEETCRECRGANEVYESCRSSSCWEYTCKDVKTPLSDRRMRFCTEDCKQGCRCHDGFYRDRTSGVCVTANMCLVQEKNK